MRVGLFWNVVRTWIWSLVPLLLARGSNAAYDVPVYRLAQFDVDNVPFGSRTSSFNHHVTVASGGTAQRGRSVVFAPFALLALHDFEDFTSSTARHAALVIVLPHDMAPLTDAAMVDTAAAATVATTMAEQRRAQHEKLIALESMLMSRAHNFPVYFTFESNELRETIDDVQHSMAQDQHNTWRSGGYRAVVKTKAGEAFKAAQLHNFVGWIAGSEGGTLAQPMGATIAIVAHYDAMAAAPYLAYGGDGNGSGVAALLSLVKIISAAYRIERGAANFLFILTAAGSQNFGGAAAWVNDATPRTLDSIDFAICIDAIASTFRSGDANGTSLQLYYSKPPKDPVARRWYGLFKSAAAQHGVALTEAQRKVNVAEPYKFEHEVFSKRRVLAATLSARTQPHSPLESSGIDDGAAAVDLDAVARSVRVVADALLTAAYAPAAAAQPSAAARAAAEDGAEDGTVADGGDDVAAVAATQVIGGSLDVQPAFVQRWLTAIATTPRAMPHFSRASPLCTAMLNVLRNHTDEAREQSFPLDTRYRFYRDERAVAMRVLQSTSVAFEAALLTGAVLWVTTIYVYVRCAVYGVDDLVQQLRSTWQASTLSDSKSKKQKRG